LQAVAADKILKSAPGGFVTDPAIPELADAASRAMGSIGTGREALEAR
jgi:hypothetical protein